MNWGRTSAARLRTASRHTYADIVLVLVAAAGVLFGAVATTRVFRRAAEPSGFEPARPSVPVPGVRAVLEALPVAVLVVDVADEVLLGNRAARDLGLIRDGVLAHMPALRRLVRRTRHEMVSQEE